MAKRSLVFLVVLTLLLTGCQSAKQVTTSPEFFNGGAVPPAEPQAPEMDKGEESGGRSLDSQAVQTERIVIRNASLSIVVEDPAQVMEDILRMANDMGGFVVNSQLYQRSTQSGAQVQEASVTIRVPVERLDDAREQIKGYVKDPKVDILSDNVSGQDVTQEYTDLESRLRNQEAAAAQLREIMETATKPEDVLRVFNELKAVNQEIELLKGQIKYFDEAAAMSAISVTIQAEETVEPVSVAGWSPKGVARDALQALIDIYQFIASAAIWIVITCLPVAIPLGLVVFFIVKGVQRVRRKQKAVKTAE